MMSNYQITVSDLSPELIPSLVNSLEFEFIACIICDADLCSELMQSKAKVTLSICWDCASKITLWLTKELLPENQTELTQIMQYWNQHSDELLRKGSSNKKRKEIAKKILAIIQATKNKSYKRLPAS